MTSCRSSSTALSMCVCTTPALPGLFPTACLRTARLLFLVGLAPGHHALGQFVELLLLAGIGQATSLIFVTLYQLAQALQTDIALLPALAGLAQVFPAPLHAARLLLDGSIQLTEEALVVDHPLRGDALPTRGQPLLLIFAEIALQFAQLVLALQQLLLRLSQGARRVAFGAGGLIDHRRQTLDSPILHDSTDITGRPRPAGRRSARASAPLR